MRWTVETLEIVDSEIEALPPGLQARLIRLMEAVENVGLEQLREPHVKHLEGKLWERRVVILHVFVKKSQKTPKAALEIARARMKEVKP